MITKKIMLAVAIIAVAASLVVGASSFNKKPQAEKKTTHVLNYYRFMLDNPASASTPGYVSDVNNWSTNQVPVDLNALSCASGTYQPCEIITAIADVDASTHKMKGTIAETPGSSSYNIVSSYTPSTGSSAFRNRKP